MNNICGLLPAFFILIQDFIIYIYNMRQTAKKLNIKRTVRKVSAKKTSIILSYDEYNILMKEIEYYKKTIEELQDELDAYESDKIKKSEYQKVKFDVNDYVSDRNRKISEKNIKESPSFSKRKNSKIYK